MQVYTVARRPAESFVAPLDDAEVDAIVALVRTADGSGGAGVLRSRSMKPEDEPPQPRRSDVLWIMAGLLAWGGYLAIGAVRVGGNHAALARGHRVCVHAGFPGVVVGGDVRSPAAS